MIALNETHDPNALSWVSGAAPGSSDFPLQNLPFGVFCTPGLAQGAARVGVAIGDYVADVTGLLGAGLIGGAAATAAKACASDSLNALMACDAASVSALRKTLFGLFKQGNAQQQAVTAHLYPRAGVQLLMPVRVANFTDFFTSVNHANNCSRIFDPNKPELPNFRSLPIAYHGRASSVMVSGTPCVRPQGQIKPRDATLPIFAPCRSLDFELEVGCYVSQGNALNHPVALTDAEQHIFGVTLVNDWSARDIQGWESMPLGPFLGKSFLTTVSPWVVTLEALAPFRCPAADRGDTPIPLMSYLDDAGNRQHGGINIKLAVSLVSEQMRSKGLAPHVVAAPNFADQYWTLAQMLTHHTSNGCNLINGDLLGSGTVSGTTFAERGCMLERTEAGRLPIQLPTGEERRWLEDGDDIIMTGRCERAGFVSIGLGECSGRIVPSRAG